MKIGSEWWTSPTESENGRLIIVTGRGGIDEVRNSGKYNIRVEVTWKYPGDATGMPDYPTSKVMEAVQDAMTKAFDKDPVAVLSPAYTRAMTSATGYSIPVQYTSLKRRSTRLLPTSTCFQSTYTLKTIPIGRNMTK